MKPSPDRIDYRETADITEVHAAVQREKPEPSADVTPMPLWLTGVCAGAMVWAGTYFGIFHGGLSANVYNEFESSPAVLFPQPPKVGVKPGADAAPQSLADMGKGVYGQCVACHQPSGLGVAGQFPPLAKSEFVNGSEKRLVAILLKGIQGPITVEGKPYNGAMPAWEAQLSPKKIAAVASYVRREWGNTGAEISEAKVLAAKKEFAEQTAPFTEAELLKIPADATLPDEGGAAAPAPTPGGAPAPAVQTPAAPVASANASPEQLAEGKKHYMMICVACHQPTGAGLPGVFPPLTKSPYVEGSPERFAAIILKGNGGPFTVDGKPFNQIMPGQEAALTDAKIAAIMTFVRANFGNAGGPVAPEVVAAARAKFADHKTPWTQAELDAWKDDAPAAK
ncbi:MAG: c-type cytochrome [Chthoniobacter sp.]|nr:c-type cytochrome [Chthoniobacter sp.]